MADFITVDTPTGEYTIDKDKIVSVHHATELLDMVTFTTGDALVVLAGQLKGDEDDRDNDR